MLVRDRVLTGYVIGYVTVLDNSICDKLLIKSVNYQRITQLSGLWNGVLVVS